MHGETIKLVETHLFRISAGSSAVLTKVFCYFSQPLQVKDVSGVKRPKPATCH